MLVTGRKHCVFLFKCVVALNFLMCMVVSDPILKNEDQMSHKRDSKFLFPIIRITPALCGPIDNRGTCLSSSECTTRGGTPLSGISCANGYGVCCARRSFHYSGYAKAMCSLVSVKCNGDSKRVSTSENVVTLENMPGVSFCSFTIAKATPDICQLQLDLTQFDLKEPDTKGYCSLSYMMMTDSVTIGSNFKICGTQNGRRLFLTFEPGAESTISISFRLDTGSAYKVRVTQIKCVDKIVPDHCLEYYDGTRPNMVTSFGWPRYMINNEVIYNICVESADSSTKISWDDCTSTTMINQAFLLSPWFTDEEGEIQVPISGPENCVSSSYVDIIGQNRHCGARLKILPTSTIESLVKPFSLAIRFVEDSHGNFPTSFVFHYPITMPATLACSQLGNPGIGMPVRAFAIGQCMEVGRTSPQLYCDCVRSDLAGPPPIPDPLLTPPRTGFCLTYIVS